MALMFLSSDYVFGDDATRRKPYSETDAPAPLNLSRTTSAEFKTIAKLLRDRESANRETQGLLMTGDSIVQPADTEITYQVRLPKRPALNFGVRLATRGEVHAEVCCAAPSRPGRLLFTTDASSDKVELDLGRYSKSMVGLPFRVCVLAGNGASVT